MRTIWQNFFFEAKKKKKKPYGPHIYYVRYVPVKHVLWSNLNRKYGPLACNLFVKKRNILSNLVIFIFRFLCNVSSCIKNKNKNFKNPLLVKELIKASLLLFLSFKKNYFINNCSEFVLRVLVIRVSHMLIKTNLKKQDKSILSFIKQK